MQIFCSLSLHTERQCRVTHFPTPGTTLSHLECILLLMSKSMCGTCCFSCQRWKLIVLQEKTHALLEQEFVPRFFRRKFMGLFLPLLGGTSDETAVHVVARLSSHVFTVATPKSQPLWPSTTCQHHPWLAALVAALPSPSPTNFLRCS